MFAMMMQNLKVSLAKRLARESKALANWENVVLDLYYSNFRGYKIYKRYISKNYWQFTVADDITQCTFLMYEKEAKTNA